MKKILIILIMMGIFVTSFSDEKEEMLNKRTEYFKKNYTEADKTVKKSVKFVNEVYFMKWAGLSKQSVGTVQFIREKDNIKKFKKMITVVSCPVGTTIEEYIKGYMSVVQPYIANQPVVMSNKKSKYSKDMVTEIMLVDKESKVIEYSLLRAYETKDGEVNAVIYSQRFDYDANIKDNKKMINEINKNVEKRMKDIFEIDFKIFG